MESSIPRELRCPRTQPKRAADDYAPPYPAWVARPSAPIKQAVMAYFGVQWSGSALASRAQTECAAVISQLQMPDGPTHFDRVSEIDAAGFENQIAIAYWLDPQRYARWRDSPQIDQWWRSQDRDDSGLGYFREVYSPRVERFETLFSNTQSLEGVGAALGQLSAEEVCEHAYWGSMRERIPLAQTDPLQPSGALRQQSNTTHSGRVRVTGHQNVALIRSGQDWTHTSGKERVLYTQDIEPTLRTGMEFLRDSGKSIGCYSNRYLRHLGEERTFGLSLWRSLGDLERWAESHPTHLAIFGTFMRVVQELEFNLSLRLYHEVAVLTPEEQSYEYINCHPGTGLLG